jgi:rod shape-determining protein MreD
VIFTPRIVVTVGVLILLTVIAQLALFSQTPLFGSVPNVVPVVIVALGLLGGAVPGAVCGFAAGLVLDAALGGTLGVFPLALLATGYLAGRWREGYDIVSSLVPPLLTGALCGFAALAYGGIELMLGIESTVSLLVLREIVVQALLGALLAVPIFPAIRRLLRPALVDDVSRSRTRPAPGILRMGS